MSLTVRSIRQPTCASQWSARGQHWLARVKAASSVSFDGQSMRASEVAERLHFHEARKGKTTTQWVASAPVAFMHKARPTHSDPDGKRIVPILGVPLALRLVVSRLYDAQGQIISEWVLLCDLPDVVSNAQIALWYHFRWRIESFFKLLKQAGHQLERWEQESDGAFLQAIADSDPRLSSGLASCPRTERDPRISLCACPDAK
jgi:hypothetical protein